MTAFNVELARSNMILQQIRPWEVLDQRVLDTLARLPREEFVPKQYRQLAFSDVALPLGHDAVMLKPAVEGRLLQALALRPTDQVLEVGTGSGYLTACLAQLVTSVVSVEIVPELAESAQTQLKAHGVHNVLLHTGDASQGWGQQRYDAIAVGGSVAEVTEVWRHSLKLGGRLFMVVGQPPVMEALLITRVGEQEWVQESLFDTLLPPLHNAAPVPIFVF